MHNTRNQRFFLQTSKFFDTRLQHAGNTPVGKFRAIHQLKRTLAAKIFCAFAALMVFLQASFGISCNAGVERTISGSYQVYVPDAAGSGNIFTHIMPIGMAGSRCWKSVLIVCINAPPRQNKNWPMQLLSVIQERRSDV